MKKTVFNYLLYLLLILNLQLFSQNHTMSKTPQIEKNIYKYGYLTLTHPPRWINTYDGEEQPNDYLYSLVETGGTLVRAEIRTGYKFDLSDIPSYALNITANIEVYNNGIIGGAGIVLMSDDTNFDYVGGVPSLKGVFTEVPAGLFLFTVPKSSGSIQNVTSHVVDRISQEYINFGVYSSDEETSAGSITIKLHIDYEVPLTAKNNFSGGSININVNNPATSKTTPSTFNVIPNISTVTLAAVEQTKDNYERIWHTGSLERSNWDRNYFHRSFNQTFPFTASESDANKTYTANLRKRCNITFRNEHVGGVTGGTIKINGTNYNSPTSAFPVVEQNNIIGTANWHIINGIEYNFDHWSDGSTVGYNHTFTPSVHENYKAHFVGRPYNSYRNLQFNNGDPVGSPIEVSWNQHPNSNVSEYRIYRKTKYGAETLISTVDRTTASSYTYTDGLYSITNNTSSDNLLSYDVRAYYSTEGTVSDYDWLSVYGEILFKRIEEELEDNTITDVLEYAISNYPNPFNPTTTIHYQLPEDANVSIKVFDILGKQIVELVNGEKGVGKHNVMFNSSTLSAGLYFYIIEAKPTNLNGKGFSKTKKMLLVK